MILMSLKIYLFIGAIILFILEFTGKTKNIFNISISRMKMLKIYIIFDILWLPIIIYCLILGYVKAKENDHE